MSLFSLLLVLAVILLAVTLVFTVPGWVPVVALVSAGFAGLLVLTRTNKNL